MLIVLLVLGLLACCGASFYLGVRVSVLGDDERLLWVKERDWMILRLVRARRAGRRLGSYWKTRAEAQKLVDAVSGK